jgi:hypothetical protein
MFSFWDSKLPRYICSGHYAKPVLCSHGHQWFDGNGGSTFELHSNEGTASRSGIPGAGHGEDQLLITGTGGEERRGQNNLGIESSRPGSPRCDAVGSGRELVQSV